VACCRSHVHDVRAMNAMHHQLLSPSPLRTARKRIVRLAETISFDFLAWHFQKWFVEHAIFLPRQIGCLFTLTKKGRWWVAPLRANALPLKTMTSVIICFYKNFLVTHEVSARHVEEHPCICLFMATRGHDTKIKFRWFSWQSCNSSASFMALTISNTRTRYKILGLS